MGVNVGCLVVSQRVHEILFPFRCDLLGEQALHFGHRLFEGAEPVHASAVKAPELTGLLGCFFHASGNVRTAGLETRHGLAAEVGSDLMEALMPAAQESSG
jgi:hypothetical protein